MDAYVRNTATGLLFWTRIRTVSSDGIVRLTRTISLQRGVGVMVGVLDGVGVAVGVGRESVEGSPTTRAVRNISTMPSRLAVRWICGHQELRIGTIRG